jgi:hypothetical protein
MQALVDPFSAVDKKMPQLEKQASAAFQLDSDDSSSDDALFNPNRYGRKDTFSFGKPATAGAGNTARSTGREAGPGGVSAFPPTGGPSGVMTAPARVSTFTPSKPGTAAGSADDSPAPIIAHPAQAADTGAGTARNVTISTAAAPGPAHGMKMSDSFDDLSPGRSPTSPLASSLPHISPAASFRGAASTTKREEPTAKKDDSDLDDLDISGIVRVNIDEDMIIQRRGSHKSPSHAASARPKTARSPRSSFAPDTAPSATSSTQPARPSTAAVDSTVPASARTTSPAGVLTSAVGSFTQEPSLSRRNSTAGALDQESLHSRRNSATNLANSTQHTAFPSSAYVPSELPVPSSFGARKGTKEDLLSIMEETEERGRPPRASESFRSFGGADYPTAVAPPAAVPAEVVTRAANPSNAELESKLLREIEELKVKLTHPQPASFRHAQLEASAEEREHYRLLQDSNIKYLQEVIDQKRIIAQLESEISRLKDEAIIKARHTQEEMLWVKEKYESEIKDLKIKSSIETEALERRQEDALASLKKLHAHEIESIKERYKSEEKFELIAGQLRSTSGSIQFIEQALQTRQRGVEAMREGQIDARERLLQDLEGKARERAEIAEAEGYRLKGILSHMEHVVGSLREQGNEEKERLRQEHARLQARQTAFEAERSAQQTRNLEELAYIKQRSKEVELELVRLTQEKQRTFEVISEAQRKLDTDRAEFEVFAASSKRAIESAEARLRDEEQRINRARNDMLQDKAALEERRLAALKDIESAEEVKNILVRAQQENESEKAELRRISQSYKAASEEILQQEAALKEQQESLDDREIALREGFAQMKLAAAELAQRERVIAESTQMLERKRQAVDRADRESMEHRLVSAANFREWTMRQSGDMALLPQALRTSHDAPAWAPKSSAQPDGWNPAASAEEVFQRYDFNAPPSRLSGQGVRHSYTAPRPATRSADFDSGFDVRASTGKENLYSHILAQQQAEKPWIESFQDKLKHAFHNGAGSSDAGPVGLPEQRLPAEVRSAQSLLRQSRSHLSKVTSSTLNTQRMLAEEDEFLNALKGAKKQQYIPI